MAKNQAPRENGAGDDDTASSSSDVRVHQAALLTAELAENCATNMFTLHADGPHATNVPTIAGRPTIEEIIISQAGVLAAIGEKGSVRARWHTHGH